MINFIIPSEKEITRYLNVYPEFLGLILKIVDQLNEKFDEEIEVEITTEMRDEKGLYVTVRCKNYENVMERIREIRQSDFYLEVVVNSKSWFLLTTDFRSMED